MASTSYGDSSLHGLGVVNDDIKAIIILPFSKRLYQLLHSKKGEAHINTMELIALFLGYIMFLAKYESTPNEFPPHPQIRLFGDNKSANKWFHTFSGRSESAKRMLSYFAEYVQYSPVSATTSYVESEKNEVADDLSRVYKLFSNKRQFMYDLSYYQIYKQVCHKYKRMHNYSIFLPSQEILFDISSMVYSEPSTVPAKRQKNLGQFYQGNFISSGSANNTGFLSSYFL